MMFITLIFYICGALAKYIKLVHVIFWMVLHDNSVYVLYSFKSLTIIICDYLSY